MNITKRNVVNKKTGRVYDYYYADIGTVGGKRVRRTFPSYEAAQAFIRTYKRNQAKYGTIYEKLSPARQVLVVEAFDRLESAGLQDSVLVVAVDEYLQKHEKLSTSIPIEKAFEEYLSEFSERQHLHVRQIHYKVGPFVSFVGPTKVVASLTTKHAEKFFADLEKQQKTANTYNQAISYIRTFFNWCIQKKYAYDNPTKDIKEKSVPYEDPVFIKPHVLGSTLHTLERDTTLCKKDKSILINFITLSFFGGARTSEIFRLTEEAIHPEDKHPFFRVSTAKGAQKGIKGRIVELEPNAVEWLRKYPFRPFNQSQLGHARERAFKGVLSSFREAFEQNIGRHSFITYHCAKFRNNARTESLVGTSSAMRVRHYQGLATTEEAEDYFNIFPNVETEPPCVHTHG